tara:strand:+ start:14534 stop:14935 length:402 start_codon:yes stop_codon:yes gene_type:complete
METLIDAIHEAITPHLSRIETKLDAVEKRIAAHVPRRPVTDSTKRRHRDVVSALGGRCPCCGVNAVLGDTGAVLDAEYDHFYSRERRDFTETWLICKRCHRDMGDRIHHTAAFQAYQQRALQIEAGQLALFGM